MSLSIRKLNLTYNNNVILKNINLSLEKGQTLGIIGQSGSGKSMFAKSLIGLLNTNEFKLSADELRVVGVDVLNLSQKELQEYRNSDISLIFQDAVSSFHPLYNFGDIFAMNLKRRFNGNIKMIKEVSFERLYELGFDEPNLIWHKFVGQISGGMAGRIQIALALCSSPKMLICDEITSSLDSVNQARIIEILKHLKNELDLIIITHEPGVVAELADQICVFKGGEIVEKGDVFEVFNHPKNELTKMIINGNYGL